MATSMNYVDPTNPQPTDFGPANPSPAPAPAPAPAPTVEPPSSGTSNQGMMSKWYEDYMKSSPQARVVAPAEWKADDSQSVQAQIGQITTSGSPLNALAETKAKQEANARGMLNSSMAIGAGQKALYESALPIAQADANINAQRGQINASLQNEAAQSNASEANKLEAARYDTAAKFGLQDSAQADALARMAQQFKDNAGMVELQAKLADDSLPKQFASNFTTQMTDRVGAILADPNLSSEIAEGQTMSPKAAAVQNAIDFANSSLSWIGTMYNMAFPSLAAPSAGASSASGGTSGIVPATAEVPSAAGTTQPVVDPWSVLNQSQGGA